ncbi:hypothetical protein EBB79_09140 [Parasedimentitalea marina]|uniref:Uncharacterized protein n=1 Tax=Parasedimentitalea marina TaxID=2483033 RepID=A0A3T0N1Z4_9RHOB|nr:hypothetical protein EBB79_09140 [Parasedimentitalea marina]
MATSGIKVSSADLAIVSAHFPKFESRLAVVSNLGNSGTGPPAKGLLKRGRSKCEQGQICRQDPKCHSILATDTLTLAQFTRET